MKMFLCMFRHIQAVTEVLPRILTTHRTLATSSGSGKNNEDLSKSFFTIERTDVNIYRASPKSLWRPFNSRFVFGGQVMGQALTAAFSTVQKPLTLHSFHCYFLKGEFGTASSLPMDALLNSLHGMAASRETVCRFKKNLDPAKNDKPILYHVDRTRDGKTYSSRNIKATQDGVPIFTMQASFKIDETDPLEHQFTMPVVPNPEDLISSKDYMKNRLQTENLTDAERIWISEYLMQSVHLEFRPVDPKVYHRHEQGEARRLVWVRAMEDIGDNTQIQQCFAGIISDLPLLGTARQPAPIEHKIGFVSSLDHSMWFHNSFRADDWMLFEIENPFCGKGKLFLNGRMWRRDGILAVSIAQEGIMRSNIGTPQEIFEPTL